MAFIASILSLASQPAGTLVLQNTKLLTDAFVLEELTSGTYSIVPADEYRVKPSGFIVKRSEDDDGNGVDWSAYTAFYATGYYARPDAIVPFVREPVTFAQVAIDPPTDADNALDLELAYGGLVRDLIAGAGDLRIDENGLLSGDVSINSVLRLGHGVQTKKPRTAANVDNGGAAWTTPNNIKRSDNLYASTGVFVSDPNTDYLWLDDFKFRIPQGATVLGIAVNVEGYHDTAEGGDAVTGQLVKNGALVGTTDNFLWGSDTSENTQVLGGATDLWGSEWGSEEINNADFGVAIWLDASAVIGGAITYLDSVTVTVYYRTALTRTQVCYMDGNHVDSMGVVNMDAVTATPANPAASDDANFYVKGGKLICQYNDGGTVRWKYLNMTGTGVTWTHSTSEP